MARWRLDEVRERAGEARSRTVHITADLDEVVARVTVVGELDVSNVPLLRAVLEPLYTTPLARVDLDLGRVGFLDSAGLRVLIAARRRLAAQGTVLRVSGASMHVRRLLAVTRLSAAFEADDAPEPAPALA